MVNHLRSGEQHFRKTLDEPGQRVPDALIGVWDSYSEWSNIATLTPAYALGRVSAHGAWVRTRGMVATVVSMVTHRCGHCAHIREG